MKECKKAFGWRWHDDNGEPTPKNIISIYKADLEELLTNVPLSISHKIADNIQLVMTIKHNLDTAKLMESLNSDKKKLLSEFDSEFKNDAINKYLKEGTFLNVKGSTFMDWLGDVWPAHDELSKYQKLFEKDMGSFCQAADTSNSTVRERWWWFDKEVMHPKELVKEFNNELEAFNQVAREFDDIKDEVDLIIHVAPDNDQIYADYEQDFEEVIEMTPLDPNTPLLFSMDPE